MNDRRDKKYRTDHFQDLVCEMAVEILMSRSLDNPYTWNEDGTETLTEEKQDEFNEIHTWVENKFEAYEEVRQ